MSATGWEFDTGSFIFHFTITTICVLCASELSRELHRQVPALST